MSTGASFEDTPSITGGLIATPGGGRPRAYSELTGREKRDYLFDEGIRRTAYGGPQGGTRPAVITGLTLFSKSALDSITQHRLGRTLTRVGDELEEPQPKLFHTYGTTARIVFTPEPGTPYTGLLADTVPGLARFSYAGPVVGVGVVPGLGLKFLIDGDHPSENLVVMRKLDRQQPLLHALSTDTHNSVFQNPFTNILPDPAFTNLVMRVVKERFESVVQEGRGLHQPLDNFGRVRANGQPVPEDGAAAPHRVILRPTAAAVAASDPTLDFRDDLARNIRAGMVLYDVLGLDEAEETGANGKPRDWDELCAAGRKIGTIASESEFIASAYGDYRLFFKHNARYLKAAPEQA